MAEAATQILSPTSMTGGDVPNVTSPRADPAPKRKSPEPSTPAKMNDQEPRHYGTPPTRRTLRFSPAPKTGNASCPSPTPALSSLAKALSHRRERQTPQKRGPIDESKLDVPDKDDDTAEKPKLGEPQLSAQAIRMRAQRIFKPRSDGSMKVSAVISQEWRQKGDRRKMLEQIFLQCGYDPATCQSRAFQHRGVTCSTVTASKKRPRLLSYPKWRSSAAKCWSKRSLLKENMLQWR